MKTRDKSVRLQASIRLKAREYSTRTRGRLTATTVAVDANNRVRMNFMVCRDCDMPKLCQMDLVAPELFETAEGLSNPLTKNQPVNVCKQRMIDVDWSMKTSFEVLREDEISGLSELLSMLTSRHETILLPSFDWRMQEAVTNAD